MIKKNCTITQWWLFQFWIATKKWINCSLAQRQFLVLMKICLEVGRDLVSCWKAMTVKTKKLRRNRHSNITLYKKCFFFVMRVPFVFPCSILKVRNTCEENVFDRTEIKTAENRKESVPYLVFPLGLTRTLLRTLFAEVFAVPVQRVVPLHFYLDRLLVGPPWDPRQQAEIYRK